MSGEHTASGKPILANDTHLAFSIPGIWYIVHLTAPGWNVAGFTFPGSPLVVIGHNERIAWGFTNSNAEVEDLYIESIQSGESAGVQSEWEMDEGGDAAGSDSRARGRRTRRWMWC